MKALLGRIIEIGVLALLLGCSITRTPIPGSHTQVSSLQMNGDQAKVVMLKQPTQITVSISAKSDAKHQVNWSELQVWAGRYPFSTSGNIPVMLTYGGTNLAVPLVSTFKRNERTETAIFELQADPTLIESLSDVLLKFGDNQSSFNLPLERMELLARFTARASEEELSQFEILRNSSSGEARRAALEMVLFKLTAAELKRVGIRQCLVVPATMPVFWDVAELATCTSGYTNEQARFSEVLQRETCPAYGIGNMRGITWAVDRKKFFQARDSLLAAKRERLLSDTTQLAIEPNFKIE